MHFDATLNLLWAVLGALALAVTATASLHQHASSRGRSRILLVIGLVIAALFPYISASDDMVRLAHAKGPASDVSVMTAQGSATEDRASTDDLIRLYETLDAPLFCGILRVVFAFVVVALVSAVTFSLRTRTVPDSMGRSPPFALSIS